MGRVHDGKLSVALAVAQLSGCPNEPVFCRCDKGNRCFSLLKVDYGWALLIIERIWFSPKVSSLKAAEDSVCCLAMTLCIWSDVFTIPVHALFSLQALLASSKSNVA